MSAGGGAIGSGRAAVGVRVTNLRPAGGRHLRLALGTTQPAQEIVRRYLGDPALAGTARLQVLAHRPRGDVVELAQAIGTQDLVGRVNGGGAHNAISWSGQDCRSVDQSLEEKGRNDAGPAAKNQINVKFRSLLLVAA